MQPPLFKNKELLSLVVWSFFSFSVIRFFFIFVYITSNNLQYFLLVTALYSLLSFLNYFVFKLRFGVKLNYGRYIICNILFGILITAFSYGYYVVVMLPGDNFKFGFYITLLLSNTIVGSLLYFFTLIKRSAV